MPCSLDGTTAQKIRVMLVLILDLLSLFLSSFIFVLGGINHRIYFYSSVNMSFCYQENSKLHYCGAI